MNLILVLLGLLSFAIGMIGVFLPILPTVPFMILAAYLFSKSSPRLYEWITNLPKIGPAIHEWNTQRVIRKRSKIIACIMIACGMGYPILFKPGVAIVARALMAAVALTLIGFISTRKSEAASLPEDKSLHRG